jgi:hypothetical protein
MQTICHVVSSYQAVRRSWYIHLEGQAVQEDWLHRKVGVFMYVGTDYRGGKPVGLVMVWTGWGICIMSWMFLTQAVGQV